MHREQAVQKPLGATPSRDDNARTDRALSLYPSAAQRPTLRLPKRLRKRSTRPPESRIFCLPV